MQIKLSWLIILLCVVSKISAQKITVTGKITHRNEAIGFANIGIQGTTTGAIANDDGKYTLQIPKPGVYTLVISAIGFETAHKRVVVKDNKTMVLNVALEQSQSALNEVTHR